MFEELKRKEEIKELKALIGKLSSKMHEISTKLDELGKFLKKGETPPKTAQKQVKMDISQ